MALVLDAGALIGIERQRPAVLDRLRNAGRVDIAVYTSSAVVAQVWRDGARQARLVLALRGVHEVPLDKERARAVGELLAASGSDDVVDAAVVELAEDGDTVLTSDADHLVALAEVAGRRVRVIPI